MSPDVVLVSTYPSPGLTHAGNSGVASYTANLARALSKEEMDVAVVTPGEGANEDQVDDGILVRRIAARGTAVVPALTRAALEMSAAIVHLQHETFLFGGAASIVGLAAALRSLRRRGSGTVVTMHQVVAPDRVTPEFTRMHRINVPAPLARMAMRTQQTALANSFDSVVVHAKKFAEVIPGAMVIPHGVETMGHLDRGEARRILGIENETRMIVLCFGFVAPYKGLELALEAAVRVPGVRLVIAGGPHPRLGPTYARQLERRWGSVATFTGHVPDHEVAAWHAAADLALFCYPSPHAASGALALALAQKTPVLTTSRLADCLDAPQMMRVGHDPSQLAERLAGLASSRGGLTALGSAVRQMADSAGWPQVARQHQELYEEVLDARRPGSWATSSASAPSRVSPS